MTEEPEDEVEEKPKKELKKKNRNNEDVPTRRKKKKKMKSNVEDFKDVEWNRETRNPIINDAIEHDDFTFTITFQGQQYDVRSPSHKLIREIRRYRTKVNNGKLTDNQKADILEEYEDTIEEFIEDVVVDFKFEDIVRISEQETDWLHSFCWELVLYSKKKSREQVSDSS